LRRSHLDASQSNDFLSTVVSAIERDTRDDTGSHGTEREAIQALRLALEKAESRYEKLEGRYERLEAKYERLQEENCELKDEIAQLKHSTGYNDDSASFGWDWSFSGQS
jgi:chromosome segregation ATPase